MTSADLALVSCSDTLDILLVEHEGKQESRRNERPCRLDGNEPRQEFAATIIVVRCLVDVSLPDLGSAGVCRLSRFEIDPMLPQSRPEDDECDGEHDRECDKHGMHVDD